MDQTKEEIQKRFTPFTFLCRGRETGRLAGVGVAARSPEDRVAADAILLEPQLARTKDNFRRAQSGISQVASLVLCLTERDEKQQSPVRNTCPSV